MSHRLHQLFAAIAIFIVLVAVLGGFVIVGSPTTERLRKLDERRIEDLRTIQREIRNIVYEGRTGVMREDTPINPLPKTLDEIARQARARRVSLHDPATGESYEYRVVDETHFELCCTFTLFRDRTHDVAWNHPAGRYCFAFNVRTPEGPTPRADAKQ